MHCCSDFSIDWIGVGMALQCPATPTATLKGCGFLAQRLKAHTLPLAKV